MNLFLATAYLSFHLLNAPRCWSIFFRLSPAFSIYFSRTSDIACVRCAITVPFRGPLVDVLTIMLLLLSKDDIVLCAEWAYRCRNTQRDRASYNAIQCTVLYTFQYGSSMCVCIHMKMNVLHNLICNLQCTLYLLARMVIHEQRVVVFFSLWYF